MSNLEETFAMQIRVVKLPAPEREYRFHPVRRFRLDFAWPDLKIGVEIHGGTWSGGRHVRGGGFHNDLVKGNLLALAGWKLLCGDAEMVISGELINALEELIHDQ